MNEINPNNALIIVGIIAIAAELFLGVSTGFDLLIIGVIGVVSGLLGMLSGSVEIALVSISALSVAYIFVGRAFIKSKLTLTTRKTNIDAVIGKKGIIVKKITPSTAGQVKVEGEIWRAEADVAIDEGTEITVNSVSGVTLRVTR